MAAIQNRSRIVVTVRARADLARSFPFDALDPVQSYVDELRSKGFKPTAKQASDTWEVRIRQKGFPSQNLTFKSYARAQTFIKKVESERSTGLFRDYTKAHLTTFAELLVRYLREFKRKSSRVIAYKIEAWLEDSGPNGQRLLAEHRKAQEEAGLPVRKAGFQMRKAVQNIEWLPSGAELQVRRLNAFQGGVPTFYRGYFEQPIGCSALSRIGPSSRSFQ